MSTYVRRRCVHLHLVLGEAVYGKKAMMNQTPSRTSKMKQLMLLSHLGLITGCAETQGGKQLPFQCSSPTIIYILYSFPANFIFLCFFFGMFLW